MSNHSSRRYLLSTVREFALAGGFDAICRAICSLSLCPEGGVRFDVASRLIGALCVAKEFLTNQALRAVVTTTRYAGFRALLKISEAELRNTKDVPLIATASQMRDVFAAVDKPLAAELYQRFEREYALRLLRCSRLELRLKGVTLMQGFVSMVEGRCPRASCSVGDAEEHEQRNSLAHWFVSINIVSLFFDRDSLHVELARRSTSILRLLAESSDRSEGVHCLLRLVRAWRTS